MSVGLQRVHIFGFGVKGGCEVRGTVGRRSVERGEQSEGGETSRSPRMVLRTPSQAELEGSVN